MLQGRGAWKNCPRSCKPSPPRPRHPQEHPRAWRGAQLLTVGVTMNIQSTRSARRHRCRAVEAFARSVPATGEEETVPAAVVKVLLEGANPVGGTPRPDAKTRWQRRRRASAKAFLGQVRAKRRDAIAKRCARWRRRWAYFGGRFAISRRWLNGVVDSCPRLLCKASMRCPATLVRASTQNGGFMPLRQLLLPFPWSVVVPGHQQMRWRGRAHLVSRCAVPGCRWRD